MAFVSKSPKEPIMYKSIDIRCPECSIRVQLIDVPSGSPLPDEVICDECDTLSPRLISCGNLKGQIQERVMGGEMVGGQLVRRYTGWKETEAQHEKEVAMRRAVKRKDADTANGLAAELNAEKKQAQKNIGKAKA